jgi:hypothetical protein
MSPKVKLLLFFGFSTREVAEKFNINQYTVVRIRQKYIIFNTFEHLCGSPTVISDQINKARKKPRNSLRKFKEKIREETGETRKHIDRRYQISMSWI